LIKQQVDILIIGGGIIGATLMLALAKSGFTMLLVDAYLPTEKMTSDFDTRSLALSSASVRIFNMLGVWPLIENIATAINTIEVSEQHSFGKTILQKTSLNNGQDALGFVVEMQYINQALQQCLVQNNLIAPAKVVAVNQETNTVTIDCQGQQQLVTAKLIIAADGSQSSIRRLIGLPTTHKNYQQQAIIANIGLNRAHRHHAYERFTTLGPLAMLPLTNQRASLVWALTPTNASRYMTMTDAVFLSHLQIAFGYRLGRLLTVGRRIIYPLYQAVMPQSIAWPIVFVGNAAHTLHPVAGQGFNLGLRDVATLAQCICQDGINAQMLQNYQAQRRYDQQLIRRFTDSLLTVFNPRFPAARALRSIGLVVLNNLPRLKKTLACHAAGFAGMSTDLVCNIPIQSAKDNNDCTL
jgi:2-octaprenyl-6-methoxyphenol hydroxylase